MSAMGQSGHSARERGMCLSFLASLAPSISRLSQRYGGIGPERHAAKFAANAVESDEALAAAVGDAERQAGEALVEMQVAQSPETPTVKMLE